MEVPTPQQPNRQRFGLPTDARLVALIAIVILVLPVLALGVAMAQGIGQAPSGEAPAKFAVAPDFTLPTSDGQQNVTLSNYDDRPVLLFFFASWCVPCQEEAPHIQNAWLQYRDRGYMFIGINVSDSESDARAFIQKYGFTFPVVRDQRGSVFIDYGAELVSEVYFLRPGRQVLSRYPGGVAEEILRTKLLAIQAPAAAQPGKGTP